MFALLPGLQARFSQQKLTKQDIIDLYAVPVRTDPAFKFEWKVAKPTTFRLSLEFKAADESEWKTLNSTERTGDRDVWLAFVLNTGRRARSSDGRYYIDVRFGFKSVQASGWSSFTAIMPDVAEFPHTTAGGRDPDNLLIVEGKTGTYRLCLQKLPAKS